MVRQGNSRPSVAGRAGRKGTRPSGMEWRRGTHLSLGHQAALDWSAHRMLVRPCPQVYQPAQSACCSAGDVPSRTCHSLLADGHEPRRDRCGFHNPRAWIGLVVGLGLCGTGLAYLAYSYVIANLGAVPASGPRYIPPVVALVMGAGRRWHPFAQYVARILILLGVAVLQSAAVEWRGELHISFSFSSLSTSDWALAATYMRNNEIKLRTLLDLSATRTIPECRISPPSSAGHHPLIWWRQRSRRLWSLARPRANQ